MDDGATRAVRSPGRDRRRPADLPGRGPPEPDQLTLVTVTHNSERELAALLTSVDAPPARARRSWSSTAPRATPAVRAGPAPAGRDGRSQLDENVGFGRACNRGVAAVRAPVTVLVNPDVELLDDSLLGARARGAARRRPERLLAPLVLSTRRHRVRTPSIPRPCSAADLVRALVPAGGCCPAPLGAALAPWRAARPRRVGWAVGLRAGGTRPTRCGAWDRSTSASSCTARTWSWGCGRRQQGVETWFWPAARVLHHRAHSIAAGVRRRAVRAPGARPPRRGRRAAGAGARRARRRAPRRSPSPRGSRSSGRWAGPAQRERRQLRALCRAARRARLGAMARSTGVAGGVAAVGSRSGSAALGGAAGGSGRHAAAPPRQHVASRHVDAPRPRSTTTTDLAARAGRRRPRPPSAARRPATEEFGVNVNRLFNDGTYTPQADRRPAAGAASDRRHVARSDALWEASEPAAPVGGVHHYDWRFDDRSPATWPRHGICAGCRSSTTRRRGTSRSPARITRRRPRRRLRRLRGRVRRPLRAGRDLLARAPRAARPAGRRPTRSGTSPTAPGSGSRRRIRRATPTCTSPRAPRSTPRSRPPG